MQQNLCQFVRRKSKDVHWLNRKFLVKPAQGYKCILIAHVHDINTILYKKIKRKSVEELQSTYEELYTYLAAQGHNPLFYRVENELSQATQQLLEQTFRSTVEIVLPHCHQRNAQERAIRIVKNYLISILCSTHENFSLKLCAAY